MAPLLGFVPAERGPAQPVVVRRSPPEGEWRSWLADVECRHGNPSIALMGRSIAAEASSWPVFKVVTGLLAFLVICVLGFAIFRIRRCARRRIKKQNAANKGPPRSPSFYGSPRLENNESEKKNTFFRRTLIDLGYKTLQPPQLEKEMGTVACSEPKNCWAQDSACWVPQNQAEQPLFASLRSQGMLSPKPAVIPNPPLPVAQRSARSQTMRTMPTIPERPVEVLDLKIPDPPSSNRKLVRTISENGDHRIQQASLFDASRVNVSKAAVGDRSSFFEFQKKVRRRPPPLTPRTAAQRESTSTWSSNSRYSPTDTSGSSRSGAPGAPIITISEATQTLLAPPRTDRIIAKSTSRGDSAFPTSPSPSDLGLASPFSSSMPSVSGHSSSSLRRDSMTAFEPGITTASDIPHLVTVVNGFLPAQDDEMAIRRGETLQLVEEFQDGWCAVERINSSERGVIPSYCIVDNPQEDRALIETAALLTGGTATSTSRSSTSRF